MNLIPPRLPPFHFPNLPSTWFIGHMARSLREMQHLVQSQRCDLIIETRDARLPTSSYNPAFDKILNSTGGKGITKRLVVYNKADLAQDCFQEPLRKAFQKYGDEQVIFTDSTSDADVKLLLRTAIRLADRPLDGPTDRISMLVAGMPNVGKSSLLNALRRVGVGKGKAASTSSQPGHTRRLSTVIKISESPPVYINDTPGIMLPFLGRGIKGKEAALKLALTGGIKESLFEGDTVAEYLLWRLRSRAEGREEGYTEADLLSALALPPSTPLDSPQLFLEALALRLSAMGRGGIPDTDFAGAWLIQAFRAGKLGRWTLDSLGRGGEAVDAAKLAEDEEADVPRRSYTGTLLRTVRKDEETGEAVKEEKLGALIERKVDESVGKFFQTLTMPSVDDMSGHQAKKLTKVAQQKVRDVKRKGKEVAKVSGAGISSARRRTYRRE
ncbi:hypothetical protein P7C70_g8555, partial [Phenoliferia sp. Uapishka_3]